MTSSKKIGICHYRIGQTDGVSLEIIKRKQTLAKMGYKIKLISGARQTGADFIIPELEFDRPDILKIKHNAFLKFKDYDSGELLIADIHLIAKKIKTQFLKIQAKEKFRYLFLHNIFTHGRHLAAAKAFYDIASSTNIKIISFNHDFYESYDGLYAPKIPEIKKFLKTYVPPKLASIKHVTINSLSQKLLYKKIKIKSTIFPDTFEFNQAPWTKDRYNSDFLKTFNLAENDLIILQGTRIVERKAIELAIDVITELNQRKKELIEKKLYNGKTFNKTSNIILFFNQPSEPASETYKKILVKKMKRQGVRYLFADNRIKRTRFMQKNKKTYSLWDAYVYADLISYPSIWEGFGNQFLEAIFAKKPIFMFEYPVFIADIKSEGYKTISLGSTYRRDKNFLATISRKRINNTATKIIRILTNKNTNEALDKNYRIGKKFHGEKILKKLLKKILK